MSFGIHELKYYRRGSLCTGDLWAYYVIIFENLRAWSDESEHVSPSRKSRMRFRVIEF